MKTCVTLLMSLMTAFCLLGADNALAKRMGGGKSVGRQSSNISQHESGTGTGTGTGAAGATTNRDAGDTTQRPGQRSNAAADAPPAGGVPQMAPARRAWGSSFLGGFAAALGFAWLAHSLGFGDGLGNFLFLAVAVVGLGLLWMRSRAAKMQSNRQSGTAFAFQGAAGAAVAPPAPYRPENVGNDASARPFERSSLGELSAPQTAALPHSAAWHVPADFDSVSFLAAAKTNFVALQSAWDRADIPVLRSMMTEAMLAEIQTQLAEREVHSGALPNSTDVVMIDALLLGIETFQNEYLASVEFSGMIREEPSAGPSPFREVWNMSKSRTGTSGWLVAGVQALQ